jgi:uncharacterized membrane protein
VRWKHETLHQWSDLRAFTIADSFEAVVKVLIIGPVVGAILGGIGGLIARQRLTPDASGLDRSADSTCGR